MDDANQKNVENTANNQPNRSCLKTCGNLSLRGLLLASVLTGGAIGVDANFGANGGFGDTVLKAIQVMLMSPEHLRTHGILEAARAWSVVNDSPLVFRTVNHFLYGDGSDLDLTNEYLSDIIKYTEETLGAQYDRESLTDDDLVNQYFNNLLRYGCAVDEGCIDVSFVANTGGIGIVYQARSGSMDMGNSLNRHRWTIQADAFNFDPNAGVLTLNNSYVVASDFYDWYRVGGGEDFIVSESPLYVFTEALKIPVDYSFVSQHQILLDAFDYQLQISDAQVNAYEEDGNGTSFNIITSPIFAGDINIPLSEQNSALIAQRLYEN